uniref:hypothetical protein n=1 Tax=Saccharothrix espanaensis TaxID=103731 RepID=UPI003F49AAA6
MITPLDNDLPPVPGTEPESTEAGRFTRLRADLRRAAREVDWTEVRAFALAAAPIALIVVLAGLLVLLLASLGGRLHDAARAVVDHPVVHVVVDPSPRSSRRTGAGRPTTLAAVWGIGALVLLIASLLGRGVPASAGSWSEPRRSPWPGSVPPPQATPQSGPR